MTKNRSHRRKQKQERQLVVHSIRRNPEDLRKLADVLIDFTTAQDEADAQAEYERKRAIRQRRADRLAAQEAGDQESPRDGGQA